MMFILLTNSTFVHGFTRAKYVLSIYPLLLQQRSDVSLVSKWNYQRNCVQDWFTRCDHQTKQHDIQIGTLLKYNIYSFKYAVTKVWAFLLLKYIIWHFLSWKILNLDLNVTKNKWCFVTGNKSILTCAWPPGDSNVWMSLSLNFQLFKLKTIF